MSNLQNNRINASINPQQLIKALKLVEDTQNLFPFLIGLNASEKRAMSGINVSNKQFVEDCLNEINNDKGLLPPFIKHADIDRDYELFKDLDKIIISVSNLLAHLVDTQFLAGTEAYSACLTYYGILKAAADGGVPGAQERYNRLKTRFVQSANTPPKTDTGNNNAAPAK